MDSKDIQKIHMEKSNDLKNEHIAPIKYYISGYGYTEEVENKIKQQYLSSYAKKKT